jgi:hypothetical protein
VITGKYVVSSNGKIIVESDNMITANGYAAINAYLTGNGRDWAGTIAIGALSSVATSSATQTLQYELARYPTTFKSYRTISGSNQVVLKTTLDPAATFSVYEIGVFPAKVDLQSYFDNYKISNFAESSSGSSSWYVGANRATNFNSVSRSGAGCIILPFNSTASINNMYFDSSLWSDSDSLSLLYYSLSTFSSGSVSVIFGDSSVPQNIWSSSVASITNITASNFYSINIPMLTKSNITDPIMTASIVFNGSSGSIVLDHLKFVSANNLTSDSQLTSRTIASTTTTPLFTKQYSQPMDIEYYIQVT